MGIKTYKNILIALIITLGIGKAYAEPIEIDLTGLSSGDGSSNHSCIYIDKYDNNYHWQTCSLCESVINKQSHSITSKNTLGNSCSDSNMAIKTCSNCNYYSETPVNIAHSWSHGAKNITHTLDGDVVDLRVWCSNDTTVCMVDKQYKYTNGALVNDVTVSLPVTLVTPRGPSVYFNQIQETWPEYLDTRNTTTYSISNGICYVDMIIYIPESLRNTISTSSVAYCEIRGLHRDTAGSTRYTCSNKTYNKSTGEFKFSYSFPIASGNRDKNSLGLVFGYIQHSYSSGGVNYLYHLGGVGKAIDLNTNNPTIASANIGY